MKDAYLIASAMFQAGLCAENGEKVKPTSGNIGAMALGVQKQLLAAKKAETPAQA